MSVISVCATLGKRFTFYDKADFYEAISICIFSVEIYYLFEHKCL